MTTAISYQLILGDEAFAARYHNSTAQDYLRDVSKAQRRAMNLPLEEYRRQFPDRDEAMARAYFSTAFTMAQIAEFFGISSPTVNRSEKMRSEFVIWQVAGTDPVSLIADYGHNPDAILALVQAVETMPAKRRSVVISGAGDRRDQDISQQTEILGRAFDDVVLYQDQCQRGRGDGEVVALARLKEGDLCLILVDQVEEALAHIAKRIAEA